MGSNAGSGQPLTFRCPSCRGRASSVRLTGQARQINDGRSRGRSTNIRRQYRCRCGHVGWSRHVDLVPKVRNRNRDRRGRYDLEDMTVMCRCGHTLGCHTAAPPHECLGPNPGDAHDCNCQVFRKGDRK